MNISILSELESIPYFTIEAIRQLHGENDNSVNTIRTVLYRWMKAGHVLQLKNGVYMTRRFFDLHHADANFAPAISAILIPQSYVSLDYILQRNAILTEITYPITAITIKHTRVIENKMGTFTYHNMKEELYTGFTIMDYMGIPFAQASVAKALFDFLYLRPLYMGSRQAAYNLADDLRLNIADWSPEEQDQFAFFTAMSKSKKMDRVMKNFRKTIWRH
jgi:predicted transcriptional regulator of viral defense system